MISASLIDPQEFEIERGVILDELAMSEDNPRGCPRGFPISECLAITLWDVRLVEAPKRFEPLNEIMWDYYRRSLLLLADYCRSGGRQPMNSSSKCNLLCVLRGQRMKSSELRDQAFDAGVHSCQTVRPVRSTRHRHIEQSHVIIDGPSMRAGDDRRP